MQGTSPKTCPAGRRDRRRRPSHRLSSARGDKLCNGPSLRIRLGLRPSGSSDHATRFPSTQRHTGFRARGARADGAHRAARREGARQGRRGLPPSAPRFGTKVLADSFVPPGRPSSENRRASARFSCAPGAAAASERSNRRAARLPSGEGSGDGGNGTAPSAPDPASTHVDTTAGRTPVYSAELGTAGFVAGGPNGRATTVKGHIYLLGGSTPHGLSATIRRLDPSSGRTSSAGRLTHPVTRRSSPSTQAEAESGVGPFSQRAALGARFLLFLSGRRDPRSSCVVAGFINPAICRCARGACTRASSTADAGLPSVPPASCGCGVVE